MGDWAGTFIRGDDSYSYNGCLRTILARVELPALDAPDY